MDLGQYILDLNRARSEEFCSPQAQDQLHLYSKLHPTQILAFKCMDGRINLPLITGLPDGVFQPFRNIGGKFDLGAPLLNDLVVQARRESLSAGSRMLALCTYHYSKEDDHRGCAGHNYETKAAMEEALRIKQQFEDMFGKGNEVVAAIVVGIETDEDALIFHGEGRAVWSVAEGATISDDNVLTKLRKLYPWMHRAMLNDLLPIAVGNQEHVRTIRRQKRPIGELVHGENIIAVGRGFGWMHLPNKALIIGPYDYDWGAAVRVAGDIVSNNMSQGLIKRDDGALLLVLTPSWDIAERDAAAEKSRYIARVAQEVLAESYPDLPLHMLVGVTDMRTLLIHEVEV
jgi:hypothetical protein